MFRRYVFVKVSVIISSDKEWIDRGVLIRIRSEELGTKRRTRGESKEKEREREREKEREREREKHQESKNQ